ncbi:MAG: hypothetical protein JXO72_10885 [Vicinamibacteria bacterium]|nr:hypothetical protein [Vicinamibacteria bacterium]
MRLFRERLLARLVEKQRILEHLGLSEPEDERPPPPDIRYVPVDDEGREITAFS